MAVSRCSALRRDGRPCGALASSPEAVFCRHHERLIETHGEAAIRKGRYPRRRSAPIVVEMEAKTPTKRSTNGGGVSPEAIRPLLAEVAAQNLDAIQQGLVEAAIGATTERWFNFTCGDCGKKQRVAVHVPDTRAQLAAVELLFREGLGRVQEAEKPISPRLPASVKAVQNMTWEEMQHVFAATCRRDRRGPARRWRDACA
jgi:hypothetical protein